MNVWLFKAQHLFVASAKRSGQLCKARLTCSQPCVSAFVDIVGHFLLAAVHRAYCPENMMTKRLVNETCGAQGISTESLGGHHSASQQTEQGFNQRPSGKIPLLLYLLKSQSLFSSCN